MWIKNEDKKNYIDSKVNGLRLIFLDGVSNVERASCKSFCDWLKRKYWFPIRIYIVFVPQKKFKSLDDGHYYYGIFYSNLADKRFKYPRICVAVHCKSDEDVQNCYFTIAHELTHYFQWYFYEDEKCSSRSLEIGANKWARYIVDNYLRDVVNRK